MRRKMLHVLEHPRVQKPAIKPSRVACYNQLNRRTIVHVLPRNRAQRWVLIRLGFVRVLRATPAVRGSALSRCVFSLRVLRFPCLLSSPLLLAPTVPHARDAAAASATRRGRAGERIAAAPAGTFVEHQSPRITASWANHSVTARDRVRFAAAARAVARRTFASPPWRAAGPSRAEPRTSNNTNSDIDGTQHKATKPATAK